MDILSDNLNDESTSCSCQMLRDMRDMRDMRDKTTERSIKFGFITKC